MAKITGKDLYVGFAALNLAGLYRSVSVTEDADLVDVTAGTEAFHSYLFTREDGNLEYEGLFSTTSTGTLIRNATDPGDEGTLIIGPYGTASAAEKWSCNSAFVRTRRIDYPYDGEIRFRVTFQFSALWTASAF